MAPGQDAARGPATRCIVPDFLDTNVLVHAFDKDEPAKQARARALMRKRRDAAGCGAVRNVRQAARKPA